MALPRPSSTRAAWIVTEDLRREWAIDAELLARLDDEVSEGREQPGGPQMSPDDAARRERAVLELRRSGFGDDEIRAHENELRQNSFASTARALKEHFILERIAEEENLDVSKEEIEAEIDAIATASRKSKDQIRAALTKEGGDRSIAGRLRNRKALDLLVENARITEEEWKEEPPQEETQSEPPSEPV